MKKSILILLGICGCRLAAILCADVQGAEYAPAFQANSYVTLGTPSTLRFPEGCPFTIEGWINLESQAPRTLLYSKNNGRGSPYTCMFGLTDEGTKMAAFVGTGGSPEDTWLEVMLPKSVATNRWHHLAYAYDGRILNFFLDGIGVGRHPCRFTDHAAHSVQLGGYADGTDLPGLISDVRVWNRAHSAERIRTFMNRRLNGQEPGLRGYWPLNEGSGRVVRDGTRFNDGILSGQKEWTVAKGLDLVPARRDGLYGGAFTLLDAATGSTRFTNAERVTVTNFTVPNGCDFYQIVDAAGSGVPHPDAWQSTNSAPGALTFARPSMDTNLVFYAWFTNRASACLPWRTEGSIFYTTVEPVPAVRPELNIERLPGQNVVIHGRDLDAGSTGGVTQGHQVGIDRLAAQGVKPDTDRTPQAPFVTLSAAGVYLLRLQAYNETGRMAVSTETCRVVVSDASNATNTWTGGGADGRWESAANWSAGVPAEGQNVAVRTGNVVRLSGATDKLSTFVLGKGQTLLTEGWNSPLRATEMQIYGTVTHVTNDAACDDWGAWKPRHRILLEGGNILVADAACLDADGRGFRPGQGPGSMVGIYGGAGHGGQGGYGQNVPGGNPYGDPSYPELPGSGGGLHPNAGAGGGVIHIKATEQLTLNGTVRANGQHGIANHGAGGAGGSIGLWCRTLAGSSNGLVQVNGGHGNQQGGSGAGGRIAIHYDSARQTTLPYPRPAIRFMGLPGTPPIKDGKPVTPGMGTLYLPDLLLVDSHFTNGRLRYVQVSIAGRTRWELDTMTLDDCVFGVAAEMDLVIKKDLVLNRNSRIFLYAKPTNIPDSEPGATLRVGGNLRLNGNSWIVPFSHPTNDVSVRVFVKQNIQIASGCGMSSDGLMQLFDLTD